MRSLGADADGSEQFIGSDVDGNVVLRTTYANTAPILSANANDRLAGNIGSGEMRFVGRIPLSLIHKWKVEHGVDVFSTDPWHKKRARELLNSNEFHRLRVWGGNL